MSNKKFFFRFCHARVSSTRRPRAFDYSKRFRARDDDDERGRAKGRLLSCSFFTTSPPPLMESPVIIDDPANASARRRSFLSAAAVRTRFIVHSFVRRRRCIGLRPVSLSFSSRYRDKYIRVRAGDPGNAKTPVRRDAANLGGRICTFKSLS